LPPYLLRRQELLNAKQTQKLKKKYKVKRKEQADLRRLKGNWLAVENTRL